MLEEPGLQPLPRRGREAESERLDGGGRDIPLGKLLSRAGARRTGELLTEVRSRDLVRLQQRLAQGAVSPGIVIVALASLGQRKAELLRQRADGVWKCQLLVHLEEFEHIAADAAAEAVEKPFLGIDVERGRFLRVKRTEAFVGVADTLQRHVLLHDLDDIRLQAQIVDELLREQTHQSFSSTTVTPPPPCSGGAVANRATRGCCCRNPVSARFS